MPYVVRKIPFENVQDTSGLEAAIASGDFAADEIVALIGKVEGNGGVNDFSRVLADRVLRDFLVEHAGKTRAEALQVPIAWSGGCDGVISPHMTVFAKVDGPAEPADEKRLAVGFAVSEPILPEEIGRLEMVDKVAAGVRKAMEAAGISDSADVHFVQTKTPLLTAERIADAHSRGQTVALTDTMESMAVSNATSALGIATALGEIPRPRAEQIAHDLSVYSSVASCSSGVEQVEAQIVVVGNRLGVGGRYRIGHSVMNDALDFDGIYDAIRSAALERPTKPEQQLYRAPAFNVFRDGRVCPGSHRFPEDVGLIPESFFQSFFSLTGDTRERSKRHPDNLQALWEELDGKADYPVEDLVPQCSVAHVMAASEGRRGYYP